MRPVTEIPQQDFDRPGITGLVLYRCFGLDGTLMYIGATNNLGRRIKQHQQATPWWFAVEKITIQRYRNIKVLHQDELRAIAVEWPHFNKQGKGRDQALVGATSRNRKPLWADGEAYPEIRRAEDDILVFPKFKT